MRSGGVQVTRRDVLLGVVAASACAASRLVAQEPASDHAIEIFDSHVHVWDLKQFHLPWLDNAMPVLRRDYSVADYRAAVDGLPVVSAAYIEVNVETSQQERRSRVCD